MNSKKTISLLAMMAMCAAGSGHPVYDSQRGVKRKRNLYVKPIQPKELHEFTVKGYTVLAYSKKDAIKRLKYQGKLTNKKRNAK